MPCCLSGNRNRYLAKIDQQTQERLDTIIQQMARAQNITEVLKATDQMTWVGRMNSIQANVTETVNEFTLNRLKKQGLPQLGGPCPSPLTLALVAQESRYPHR